MAKEKNETDVSPNPEVYTEQNVDSGVRSHFFRPAIICGVCESCGSNHYEGGGVTKTVNKQGEIAYHLNGGQWNEMDASKCKHYKPLYDKGSNISCTYCGERFTGLKNRLGKFSEILASRIVYVMSFSEEPNKLIMYCDSFECKEKHLKRLKN